MAELSSGDSYTPHFIINEDAAPRIAGKLIVLERAIYNDPQSFLEGSDGLKEDHPRFRNEVALATSKEGSGAFDFDDATEAEIAHTKTIRDLQRARTGRSRGGARAEELAEKVRKARLALYAGIVISRQETESNSRYALPIPPMDNGTSRPGIVKFRNERAS